MRSVSGGIVALSLLLGAAAPAPAAPVAASGDLEIRVGTLFSISIPIPATTVDVTGSLLSVPAGMLATNGHFVPVTGFPLDLITGIVVTASNGAGVFFAPAPGEGGRAHVPGGGFGGVMPIVGVVQVKGALAINVPLSVIGKGGAVSTGGIQIEGAPWTTRTAAVTPESGGVAYALRGTSAGLAPGQITLVTPAFVDAAGLARLPVFASLRLVTVPEPGTWGLVAMGIVALAASRGPRRE